MSTLVGYAALTCVAAGLVAGGVVGARTGDGRLALRIMLDFWLAAGLLRLSVPTGAEGLLAAAAIIALRHLAVVGFGASRRAGPPDEAPPAGPYG